MTSNLKIIRSSRKSIALVIQPSGELLVRAPQRATKREINALVKKHAVWIVKKQTEARKNKETFAPHQFIVGEEFFFLGIDSDTSEGQDIYWENDNLRRIASGIKCKLLFNRESF